MDVPVQLGGNMIQFIRGRLVSVEEDRVIVDVNGVGCGIFMSVQAMSRLPQTGAEVKIHTRSEERRVGKECRL